jgi:hypothetical protein
MNAATFRLTPTAQVNSSRTCNERRTSPSCRLRLDMGPKSKGRRQASGQKSRRTHPRGKDVLPLSRRLTPNLAAWLTVLGATTGVLGALGLSRLMFLGLTAAVMLAFYLFRYRSVSLLLRNLRSQWSFRLAIYSLGTIALAVAVGVAGFRVGSKLGQAEGIRNTLSALNLPVRPLPPPVPRFPGHVDVDAFCRSEGPFQAVAPDEYGIRIEWKDGTVSEYPLPGKVDRDREFGKGRYIICAGRTRNSYARTTETEWKTVPVEAVCRWQYPGQDVKAVAPKQALDLDGWRCQLPSGAPATWPD